MLPDWLNLKSLSSGLLQSAHTVGRRVFASYTQEAELNDVYSEGDLVALHPAFCNPESRIVFFRLPEYSLRLKYLDNHVSKVKQFRCEAECIFLLAIGRICQQNLWLCEGWQVLLIFLIVVISSCLLYTSPSPRDLH